MSITTTTCQASRGPGLDGSVLLLFAFAIPISTALVNLLWPLVTLLGLYRAQQYGWHKLLMQPVVLASCALFCWMVVGIGYSAGGWQAGLQGLATYKKLLLIPMLSAILLQRPRAAAWMLWGFAGAMMLTLWMSFASWQLGYSFNRVGGYPGTAFKFHITQSLLLAATAWCCWRWSEGMAGYARWLMGALALLIVINVLLIVPGRTGYLALAALVAWWVVYRLRGWQLAVSLVASSLMLAALLLTQNPFSQRIQEGVADVQQYQAGQVETSLGLRLDFYRHSLLLIAEQPILGVGTGGFTPAYRQLTGFTEGLRAADNPHSEYLMIAAQHGLLGVLLAGWLVWALIQAARQLPTKLLREMALGWLVVLAACSLFNSLLKDFTEGHVIALLAALLVGCRQTSSTSASS